MKVMATKGASKDQILATFERGIVHTPGAKFETALAEAVKFAMLRLNVLLP